MAIQVIKEKCTKGPHTSTNNEWQQNMHNNIANQVNECLVKRLYVSVEMKKIHEARFCITS